MIADRITHAHTTVILDGVIYDLKNAQKGLRKVIESGLFDSSHLDTAHLLELVDGIIDDLNEEFVKAKKLHKSGE